MHCTATYSPDDNKIRLYFAARLPDDLYQRVKAAGYRWAPKQECFYAPTWTPHAEDLALELAGEIDDDDKSLTERAEERAERFEGYEENRRADADAAHRAVKSIADNIPLGQPILVGHHSERHARRDAEKIENGMRRAVKAWKTAEYWQRRAAGAIAHAKYKERPDVRARRIKTIEADLRKVERGDKESAAGLLMLDLIDKPEKWKAKEDGTALSREERAAYIAGRMHANISRKNETGSYWSMYDVLRLPAEERYKEAPKMTIDEALADVRASFARATAYRARWREHYENRLAYERAMLADAGGTVADRVGPEKGGAVQCWATRAGAWSYIQKVNRISVTLLDNWGNGGRDFPRTIPFDKLRHIMTRAQVEEARAAGRLKPDGERGFWLLQSREEFDRDNPPAPTPAPAKENAKPEQADIFAAMQESLRAGVQVVAAPQLFPTPHDVAQRVAELADLQPGHRVLEPSAGTGALLNGITTTPAEIVAVEVNLSLADRLRATQGERVRVICSDFLQCNGDLGKFDRVLMNPPFENGADIKHIQHARGMLAPGGRLVAICADGPRQRAALQPIADSWEELPAGTFAGTGVRAALLTMGAD